ncbi:MAG: Maf family protein [Actinomycetota bacterium]|nr:Maf family protein [Actinomycetota bacterium]
MWEEENKKIILASTSPRRQSILKIMGLKFDIIEPEGVEERNSGNPYRAVEDNSESKARFAAEKIKGSQGIVCGFDTLVYFAGSFLGKPACQEQAAQFLEKLSGRAHKVLTGVCMIDMESGQKRIGSESNHSGIPQAGAGGNRQLSKIRAGAG